MAELIAVVNAGSSSIKFSLFIDRDDQPELLVRGQAEGIYTNPRFVSKDKDGKVIAEKSWPEGTRLGHDGALEHLFTHARSEFGGHQLLGVGHRVVAGGLEYTRPVQITAEVLGRLDKLIPLFPLHQPHNLGPIRLLRDPHAAVEHADVIYTDTWTSMGQEAETKRREAVFPPYQVNAKLVSEANPGVVVLHCLPAHRNHEITDEIADGPHSLLFPQAHNRMHAQKAILAHLLSGR